MRSVEQGSWARFEPDYLDSDICVDGLGPCTGIVIFDHDSRVAYGYHFTSPHEHESDQLRDGLEAAFREMASSSRVSVEVSGCCDNSGIETQSVRTFVEAAVRCHATANASIKFRWPRKGISCTSLTLDQDTGTFYFDESQESDFVK